MIRTPRWLGVLLGLALASLNQPGVAQEPVSTAEPSTRGALINPSTAVEPGRQVRVRLDGEALSALLDSAQLWIVLAQGEQVPAQIFIEQPPLVESVNLTTVSESSPAAATKEVLLDRGTKPRPLNQLSIQIKGETVAVTVEIAYSTDRVAFSASPIKHVLWQHVTAEGVFRNTAVTCAPGSNRYIRLRATDAAGIELDRVEGGYRGEWLAAPTSVPLSLGPMRAGPSEASHLWPLILPDNRLPLVWLSLEPPQDSSIRRVELARLKPDLSVSSINQWALWTNSLPATAYPFNVHEIALDEALSTDLGWGLVVNDGEADAWEFTKPQAKAAPVWLVFAAPVEWPAVLWVGRGTPQPVAQAESTLVQTINIGKLTALPLHSTDDSTTILGPNSDSLSGSWPSQSWIVFGAIALVLALSGAVMLVRHAPR